MRHVIVTDTVYDALQLSLALAKQGIFLRTMKDGAKRVTFTPQFLNDQAAQEEENVAI